MSTRSALQNEILKFVATLPYWEKYLAAFALDAITDKTESEVIAQALQYLLEDSELAAKSGERPELSIAEPQATSSAPASIEDLQVTALSNLKNVNAIKPSKPLAFGPNVTVIYGKNGAGACP